MFMTLLAIHVTFRIEDVNEVWLR